MKTLKFPPMGFAEPPVPRPELRDFASRLMMELADRCVDLTGIDTEGVASALLDAAIPTPQLLNDVVSPNKVVVILPRYTGKVVLKWRNRQDRVIGCTFDLLTLEAAQSEARTLSEPTPATGPAQIERTTEHTSPSEPNVVEVE